MAQFWILPTIPKSALLSIPANGLGLVLLLLVVSEAQVRADSEENRLAKEQKQREAEHAHALATEAQLSALRSRVHPHFLFNSLNSIAELCRISPERAETACLNLSQLMRWTLETSGVNVVSVRDELSLTRAYVQIEQERLGDRLCVVWNTRSACEEESIVPFALQILVENAVNHGLANKLEPGTISITVRSSGLRTLVAVCDDGVGMSRDAHAPVPTTEAAAQHGLEILNQQLILRYGRAARIRLVSRENVGTLAFFRLPRS
jgi:LytS/YehU family sensor histidine kinase